MLGSCCVSGEAKAQDKCLTWVTRVAVKILLTSISPAREIKSHRISYYFTTSYLHEGGSLIYRFTGILPKRTMFVREIKNSVHPGGS